MILAGTAVRKALVTALTPVLDPIPVYSVMPPDNVLKYVMITALSENAVDPKDCFLTEGIVQIQVIEKFDTRDGDMDEVTRVGRLISATITPTRQSSLGDLENVNVFSVWIDSVADGLFESDPGRTAICSLRLKYYASIGTLVT